MNSHSTIRTRLFKALPLLAGVLSISIAATLPVLSQSTNPTAPTGRDQMNRRNFLNLTADQQTRMDQLRQNERSQIDAILTAEQKAQLQRDRQNRGTPPTGQNQGTPPTGQNRGTPPTGQNPGMRRSPFDSLNLTAEQRSRIEAVRRTTRKQMDAILTAEQRQQMQQHMQQHQQRRQATPQANQSRSSN